MTPEERADQIRPLLSVVAWRRELATAIREAVADERRKAVAEEREACAKVAEQDSLKDWIGGSTGNAVGTAKNIAAAIRARST